MQVCLLFCLGETLVLVGVRRYVFWYSLILDQSESDGVRRVPSGWCQQCIGRLFGRLMESLFFYPLGCNCLGVCCIEHAWWDVDCVFDKVYELGE